MPCSKCQTNAYHFCSMLLRSIIRLRAEWIYSPPLPLDVCTGARQRNRGERRREKERKVSDNGTVCCVNQIYYSSVLLIQNTELNPRDSFKMNLKEVEYQSTHTHSHLRQQHYKPYLMWHVIWNTARQTLQAWAKAQDIGRREREGRKKEGEWCKCRGRRRSGL